MFWTTLQIRFRLLDEKRMESEVPLGAAGYNLLSLLDEKRMERTFPLTLSDAFLGCSMKRGWKGVYPTKN